MAWAVAAAIVVFAIPQANAAATGVDQKSVAVVLPSSLPVQRDAGASFGDGNISGAMVVGVILLGALLFYVRVVLHRKKNRHQGRVIGEKPWPKWLRAANDSDGLRVVGSKSLSSTSRVHVVEWNGRRYLLAQNDHAFIVLDKVGGSGADSIPEVPGETQ
jgi:hypothetical protein